MNKQEKVKLKERRKGINEDSLKRKKEKNQTDNVYCKLLMNVCLTSARSGRMVIWMERRRLLIPATRMISAEIDSDALPTL